MKARITKEMIAEAGFTIVRKEGEAKLSVRNVAAKLGCSTQPVMYWFKTTEELRASVLERANGFHTAYLMRLSPDDADIMIGIGMNYIHFAADERNLFRFIVMSDKAQNTGLAELISSEDAGGMLVPFQQRYGLTPDQARDVFEALFVCFHGYAALVAYGALHYDAVRFRRQLVRICSSVTEDIKMARAKRVYTSGEDAVPLHF